MLGLGVSGPKVWPWDMMDMVKGGGEGVERFGSENGGDGGIFEDAEGFEYDIDGG
jgi:hypothetical protein